MEQTRVEQPRATERRVQIVVNAPRANEVILTGNFTQWSKGGIRLKKGAAGQWSTTLSLSPGEYQYRLLIDGVWCDDPTARRQVPNEFGGTNCLLEVT
jgi:1,4-alpha-glucan branching enzyme